MKAMLTKSYSKLARAAGSVSILEKKVSIHLKMERKIWPWKKKPNQDSRDSEKNTKDNSKIVQNYIKISQERYAQLSETEDQVKILDEKLKDAMKELAKKDTLVKEHSKIADELIKGWENEKAETSNLKSELESTKIELEEKTAGLDSALKECMKQLRAAKEESEQKLNETKQWEKTKLELQSKVSTLKKELVSSSQSEAENESLKSEIESYKRKVSVLKHELDAVSVEVDIQTQEKNMCARHIKVVNRQHLEDVEKILNLEAETHRLRSLIIKKLPGPSALARMKKEVQSFKKSPTKDCVRKENEILTCRLLEMETKMNVLKRASLSDHRIVDNETVSDNSVSRLPSLWKETSAYRSMKSDDMDDFLEMEKLSSASADGIKNEILISKLQAEISLAFDSHRKKNVDIRNLVTEISAILQNNIKSNDLLVVDYLKNNNNDFLKKVIIQIHDFVLWIENEAIGTQQEIRRITENGQRIMELLSSESESESESKKDGFLQSLSTVLSEIKELYSRKLQLHDGKKTDGFTHSSSDSENHQESSSIMSNTSTENQLQVSDSENSKFLAITQLKCMTESYTSLESHCQDLQKEINMLRSNPLENQLVVKEQISCHQDYLENQNTEQNGASIFHKSRCDSLFNYFCSSNNPIEPKYRSTHSVSHITEKHGHQTDTTQFF
ncbi:hypothetical protein ZOSMA_120G00670 [Zostera marina]|uniref:Uncharacterized protein n=1 Tax=Zostera marina TaxID=29655 RepID=A0A0K9Q1D8_ZOSMR|nr:hypothetical protein ZOSMA_120G00670 [Zostera marina]